MNNKSVGLCVFIEENNKFYENVIYKILMTQTIVNVLLIVSIVILFMYYMNHNNHDNVKNINKKKSILPVKKNTPKYFKAYSIPNDWKRI